MSRIHGGTPSEPYHVTDSIWAVDIKLPRVLAKGEETSLQYETTFHYTAPPEPLFRRTVHGRVRDVVIRVAFHPDHLPGRIWWTEWEDYRPPADRIAWREARVLDQEYAVEQHLVWLERAVVGFCWEF